MTYTRDEALALGHPTIVIGPSQVSIQETGSGLYVLNWITDPDQRGQGHGGTVFKALCAVADHSGHLLVTHPDTTELEATMLRYGFTERLPGHWEGKPLMMRSPKEPGPLLPYALGARLVNF